MHDQAHGEVDEVEHHLLVGQQGVVHEADEPGGDEEPGRVVRTSCSVIRVHGSVSEPRDDRFSDS